MLSQNAEDLICPGKRPKKEEEEKAAQAVSAEQMNAAKQAIEELNSQLAANEQSAPPAEAPEAPEAPEADAASDAAESADDGDNTAE